MRKTEKINVIKERLKNMYNELEDIKHNGYNQFSYSTQILIKITQATYYMDKLIKELENECNSGNKQIQN